MTRKENNSFLRAHWAALLVIALLVVVRIVNLAQTGVTYSLNSDDLSYVRSGIYLADTGVLTMHENYPSAQIMPGMSWLIALFSLVFGDGTALWAALKLFWILLSALTAWLIYRTVSLFGPKWCAVIAMLPMFRLDMVWMDGLILTETPFLTALTGMVYFGFRMGKEPGWRHFWACLACYMAALLLKANIAPFPLVLLVYLLCVRYDGKLLAKQCVALTAVVLCFLAPWTIRNYRQFHAFVPLTYGAGNPTLLGTYQGVGYPEDWQLDYETNVDEVVREEYADYYNADGSIPPEYDRFVSLGRDSIMAKYRQREWAKSRPKSMLWSYLVLKPWETMTDPFYWKEGAPQWHMTMLRALQKLGVWVSLAVVALSLIRKRLRPQVLFLAAAYFLNVYLYSITFAFSRYNASLMSLRFLLFGFGLVLLSDLLRRKSAPSAKNQG